MKSTPMRGVKQFLKPDAYKQSEPAEDGCRKTDCGRGFPVLRLPSSVLRGDGVPLV